MIIDCINKRPPKHWYSFLKLNQIIYLTFHTIFENRIDEPYHLISIGHDSLLVTLVCLQYFYLKKFHYVPWLIVIIVNGLLFNIILYDEFLPTQIYCSLCLCLEILWKELKQPPQTPTNSTIPNSEEKCFIDDTQQCPQQIIRSQKYTLILLFIQVFLRIIQFWYEEYSLSVTIFSSYVIFFALFVLYKILQKTKQSKRKPSAVVEMLQIQSQKIIENQKSVKILNEEFQQTPKIDIIGPTKYLDLKNKLTSQLEADINTEQNVSSNLISQVFSKIKSPGLFFEQVCEKIKLGIIILDHNEQVIFANKKAYVLTKCPFYEDIKKYLVKKRRNNENTPSSIDKQRSPIQLRNSKDSFLPLRSITRLFKEKQSYSDQLSLKMRTLFSQLSFMNEEEEQPKYQESCNEYQENDQLKFRMRKISIEGTNQQLFKFKILMIQNRTSKQKEIEANLNHKFKSLLLNSFSHELRTPLNCSQQLLESLSYQIIDEKIKQEFLQPIMSSNFLLLHQINDILDFAAFEAENFEYSFQSFSLIGVIDNLISIFKPAIKQKDLQLIFKSFTKTSIKNIRNDPRRVQQIIINLLNNAVKFTDKKGKIEITIDELEHGDQKFIRINVKDNGVGIDEQKLEMLNDLFLNTEKMNFNIQYVGLGLVLANKIAMGLIKFEQLQNCLQITSEVNKGTEISFLIQNMAEEMIEQYFFPINNNDESSLSSSLNVMIDFKNFNLEASKGIFDQQICKNKPQILIVDDVPFNILALKALLRSVSRKVDECYNGYEAFSMVESKFKNYDCDHSHCRFYRLILMDIQMPICDGITALKKINQFFNEVGGMNQSKIVICTAYDDKEYFQKSQKNGASGFIVKPVTMEKILPFMNNFLY